jgi:CheY-like chemotaxis protein
MAIDTERRGQPDRRTQPRGGRRPSDLPGLTPLVLVVEEDDPTRQLCEAILAKLHFAVAPAESLDKAAVIMASLQPDVIVASGPHIERLRAQAPKDTDGADVPLVALASGQADPLALVEQIRAALRGARSARA